MKVRAIARNNKVRRGITFYKKSFGSQFTLFSLLMMTDYVLGERAKKCWRLQVTPSFQGYQFQVTAFHTF